MGVCVFCFTVIAIIDYLNMEVGNIFMEVDVTVCLIISFV